MVSRQAWDEKMEEQLAGIPPETVGEEPEGFTPWETAVSRILWGLILVTFRLEVLYLQYLLPLVGAVELYLGFRSLRRENRWFFSCWILSGVSLICRLLGTVGQGTWAWSHLMGIPSVFWGLSALSLALDFLQLLFLRGGLRRAFQDRDGHPPRDWLAYGIAAWLGVAALAAWGTLESAPAGGRWIYYGRFFLALGLFIVFFLLLRRQMQALSLRGYQVAVSPVRLSSRGVWAITLGLTAALLLPALLWGARLPSPAGESEVSLSAAAAESRENLLVLGLPEELADLLSEEDLLRCAGAETAAQTNDPQPNHQAFSPRAALDGGELEGSTWMVGLPDGSVRFFHFFRWLEMPRMRLQEGFQVEPDNAVSLAEDFSGQLRWRQGEEWLTAPLEIRLAGGQTGEELGEFDRWWYESELAHLGRLQWDPYAVFSLPAGGEEVGGYIAYTLQGSRPGSTVNGGVHYYHQSRPMYPFADMGQWLAGKGGMADMFSSVPYDRLMFQNGVWPRQPETA